MKKLQLIVIALIVFAQPMNAGLGHTLIKIAGSWKTSAIFAAATTVTLTTFNAGSAYLLNKYSRKNINSSEEATFSGKMVFYMEPELVPFQV